MYRYIFQRKIKTTTNNVNAYDIQKACVKHKTQKIRQTKKFNKILNDDYILFILQLVELIS